MSPLTVLYKFGQGNYLGAH
uniref:Uncharacterized protein n=1 Tax=Salix viminalis TaxID=40686 RepID=A0A6N2NBX2_SALVM